ncbi:MULTISPECIES: hypothetical protein [unclassified Pseudomonas]|nr:MULTISPECIES: hypothetical protein [unclassified Pseudomonas]
MMTSALLVDGNGGLHYKSFGQPGAMHPQRGQYRQILLHDDGW